LRFEAGSTFVSVATGALEWAIQDRAVTVVASVDPDPFSISTQERPETFIDEDGERLIRWPENDFLIARFPEGSRDLVILSGVEPHLHWWRVCRLHRGMR